MSVELVKEKPRSFRSHLVGTALDMYSLSLSVLPAKPSALLILSHMRSGSSLLLHLLVNHPKILGYGERNAAYQSRKDLIRLYLKTRFFHLDFWKYYRYFVDQINHNDYTPNLSLLKKRKVKVLFLLRDPLAATSSLLRLSEYYYDGKWNQEVAVNYYTERLQFLTQLGESMQSIDKSAFLLTYEDLIQQPEQVLPHLQQFLGLKTPFSTTYQIQEFTGRRGDPTTNIFSGKIISRPKSPIQMAPHYKKQLQEVYQDGLIRLGSFNWQNLKI